MSSIFVVLGSRSDQPRPMTLGERKRNGPRVLVNRLTLNNEIIERLRRVTKLCGKQTAVKKSDSQGNTAGEVNSLNDAENAPTEVGTNETGNGSELKNSTFNDAESKELIPEESRQGKLILQFQLATWPLCARLLGLSCK